VPWPAAGADGWSTGALPAGVDLDGPLARVFDDDGPLSRTFAVVVIHHGRLVYERYQGQLEHWDRDPEGIGPDTPLLSWSMAKSMLHATVGMLVDEGRLDLTAPADVPQWADPADPRHEITLEDLLAMRDGLDFFEDYVDGETSDVIEMLFGKGADDMASFAADRPLAAPPGTRFNYSSGTSNIVASIVGRAVGGGEEHYRGFLHDRLFGPLGATSARATFDTAGTWIASSYVHATARDFARFGLLYLRDGMWGTERLLPSGWVDTARRIRSVDPSDGDLHSLHWWVVDDGRGTFRASGYEGQSITICPAHDLVVVRLGKTPTERKEHLVAWRADMVAAFDGAA
jgi:CubicO group peptidase (beta-lactamase class C family)